MEAKAPPQAAPSGDGWKSGLCFQFSLSRLISLICTRGKASKQSEAARTWLVQPSKPGAGGGPVVQHNAADGSYRSYELGTSKEVDSGTWTLDGEKYGETSGEHDGNVQGTLRRRRGGGVWIDVHSEGGQYTYCPVSEPHVLGHRAASQEGKQASKRSEVARTWHIKSFQPGGGCVQVVQHNAADGSFRAYERGTTKECGSGTWDLDGDSYSEIAEDFHVKGTLRRDGDGVWIEAHCDGFEYTYRPLSQHYVEEQALADAIAPCLGEVKNVGVGPQQEASVVDKNKPADFWHPVAMRLWQTKLPEHIFLQMGLRFDEDGDGTQDFLDLHDVWRKTGESTCDGWRRITFDRRLMRSSVVADSGTAVAYVLDSGHVIAFFSMASNSKGYYIFATEDRRVEEPESVAGRWEAFLVDEWFSTIPSSSRSGCVLELDEDGVGRCIFDGIGYTLQPRDAPGQYDSGWLVPGPGQLTSVMESHVELPGGYTVSVDEDFFKLGCGAPGVMFMKAINKPEAMLFRRLTTAQPREGLPPLPLASKTRAKWDFVTWQVGELSAESLIGDLFDLPSGGEGGRQVAYLKSGVVGTLGNGWWTEAQRAAEKRLAATTLTERVWSLLVLATLAARCGGEALALAAVDGLYACVDDEALPLQSVALRFLRWLAGSPQPADAEPAPISAGQHAGVTSEAGVEVRVPHPLDAHGDSPQGPLALAVRAAAREALERVARPVSGSLGFRVLILSNGSRGDVQPAITLAKNLQARGCIVKALTRVGISDFCKDEGVEAVPFAADLSEVFRSMGGISQRTVHEIGHHEGQWALKHPGVLHDPTAIMDDFKPEVILWTAGERHDVAFRYEQEHGVPAIPLLALGVNSLPPHYRAAFQRFPSRPGFVTTSPLTEKDAKLDGLHRCHQTGFWSPEHDPTPEELAKKPLASLVAFLANGPPPVVVNWGSLLARGVSLEAMLLRPVLAAQLAGCRLVVLGGYARLHELGEVLEKEGGEALLRAARASHKVEDPAKTGPDINEVMARLSRGEDPGIDNDQMNQILAQIGSFSALAVDVDNTDVIEAVEDEEKRKSLEDFARTHCCFVPSAPHKWLFPQCACVVHHGGAGTTHAAMTAGRPSIVTPIAFDQFYWASVVEDLGVGVHLGGSEGLAAVRVPELAEAMRGADRATACAEELGRGLRAEPGVVAAADVLCKFLQDEVGTGGWRRRWEATRGVEQQQCVVM